MVVRIQEAASLRLDDIYRYARDRWGEAQADRYITGRFEALKRIETQGPARVPASCMVQRGVRPA